MADFASSLDDPAEPSVEEIQRENGRQLMPYEDQAGAVQAHSMGCGNPLHQQNPYALADFRREVYTDVLSMCAATMSASHQAAAIRQQQPQQVIIHNNTCLQANTAVDNKEATSKKKKTSKPFKWFLKIWESKMNRFVIIGFSCLSVYMLHQYLTHRYRMDQMQKKIDSNLMLKGSQWVSNVFNGKAQPAVQSPQPTGPSLLRYVI
uniref:Uncharacterized protein n=1 Tax=Chromera velia CCMP2878 TaxID=1169474 RepID=A0A0G4HG22_9ALVE|mmetsp:Transcript_12162/g.23530  ORF Transcript_12162/g.23530 Transcript_12162/m.23530 type:complete len:206 (+) Transcript_12162:372-989(+)|eukprot:Cvel_27235.t1-p1 / transcript=Cvel_27235.t1 / gene=Cvel_27235 / organism=Chromera_velia_CCMP2878 / gene_product=hypothetical protein / transcript_product=hypothetical protein / location=Cvel_scaffold3371:2871-6918(+) / protein_length=205 / sequence_SO=supercontig / SO=protein_coding / is_pseudo=false